MGEILVNHVSVAHPSEKKTFLPKLFEAQYILLTNVNLVHMRDQNNVSSFVYLRS